MEHYFLVIIAFLVLLAAFDLFVGVSNDAVNFLNSAIGSKVATFKTIMLVASIGVLVGATFSSGMMEIARSGVFNPEMFTFEEIMIVFFAVMVTDIFLLDIFNSFGLPTSTTVSIVFEILGGAVAAAAYKIWSATEVTAQSISDFINNEKALAIITGILISVVVAFITGAIIQYIVRLIFSFKYEKAYKYLGSTFGSLALTAILYFLVMKGAKGSSFMNPDYIKWIGEHTLLISFYTFAALLVVFQILISAFKINIFRIVILSGTFALAFAFAGNDLVNFVGVPLAAIDSYKIYVGEGNNTAMLMGSLREAVKTPTFYLLIAGLIMVLTLWFSKKAHRVVQTSINLSSGSRGAKEQFGSSLAARAIVKSSITMGNLLGQFVPNSVVNGVSKRMEHLPRVKGEEVLPFDNIRASVNLVVAAILIASATSLKLPLSTTYVTFMVAMGSSLADGAWDRESAVYRISGVLTVIGGWFMTAFFAFTLCAIVTTVVNFTAQAGVIALMALVCFILIRSNFIKKNKNKDDYPHLTQFDHVAITENVNEAVARYLNQTISMFKANITDLQNENLKGLRKAKSSALNMHEEIANRRAEYFTLATDGGESKMDIDARHYYYRIFTNMKEISHGLRTIVGQTHNHINNNHIVFRDELESNLFALVSALEEYEKYTITYGTSHKESDKELQELSTKTTEIIARFQSELLDKIEGHDLSMRRCELYLSILQFSKDIVNRFNLIAIFQNDLNERLGKK